MARLSGPGRTRPGLGSWPLLLLLLMGLEGPVSATSEAGKWILDVHSVSVPNVAGGERVPARQRADVSFSFWAVILMSIKSEEIIKMTLKTALSLVSWSVVGFCDEADVTTRRKDLMLCCVKTLDKSSVCRCILGGSEST